MTTEVFYFLISFMLTMISVPLVRKIALKYNIVDKPDARKVHRDPKPYLGGLCICLVSIFTYFLSLNFNLSFEAIAFSVIGLLICLVGLYDDIKDMKATYKLIAQIVLAFLASILVGGFGQIHLLWWTFYLLTWQSLIIQTIWIVAIINAFNLIDGLDGLASGLGCIALFFLYIFMTISGIQAGTTIVLIMIGTLLGFLYYNFYPSIIFLGDSGSMFIGYFISIVSINQFKTLTFSTIGFLLLVAFIPIMDVFLSIFRRKINKKKVFSADALHFHHRLIRKGFSHQKSVILMYLVMIVYGLLSIGILLTGDEGRMPIIIVTIIFTILVIENLYLLGTKFTIFRRFYEKNNKDIDAN
ncbi:MAG: glycosyltransferase family 4 protein [Mycoplasmatales bacterium]